MIALLGFFGCFEAFWGLSLRFVALEGKFLAECSTSVVCRLFMVKAGETRGTNMRMARVMKANGRKTNSWEAQCRVGRLAGSWAGG